MEMYNMSNNIVEIDPELFKLDDPRVQMLLNGQMTQIEFIRLIRPDDPFQMQAGGKIKYISKDDQNKMKESFIKSQRENKFRTGGITPSMIVDIPEFLEVYPEIFGTITKEIFDKINSASCKGCEKNRLLSPVLESLLQLKYDGRDLTKLSNKIPPIALKRLNGELTKEEVDVLEIQLPMGILKREIPFLENGKQTANYSMIQNPKFLKRPGCKDCFKKHLSSAYIMLGEALIGGYTSTNGHDHERLAAAHIREGVDEILDIDIDVAKETLEIAKILDRGDGKDEFRASAMSKIENILSPSQPKKIQIIGMLSAAEEKLASFYTDSKEEFEFLELAKKIRDIRLKVMDKMQLYI